MSQHSTKNIIEAALLTAGKPLSLAQLQAMLSEDETPLDKQFVLAALDALADDLSGRGVELRQVASGYRLQVKQEFEPWVARLFEERPPRYSRALLETLALIAYRQPITRAEIEDVRGVSVSSNIVKTLLERDWVKVVGQRDVPGRPSMYGTTKLFLDYFNVKSVAELPPLDELMDLDKIDKQLDMLDPEAASQADDGEAEDADAGAHEAEDATAPQAVADDNAADVPEAAPSAALGDAESELADQPGAQADGDDSAGTQAGEAAGLAGVAAAGQLAGSDPQDVGEDHAAVASEIDAADPGDNVDSPSSEAGDDADIDSLVNMLEAMDDEPESDTNNEPESDVNADADLDQTTAAEDLAAPSTLARGGDTVAAVEAARLALAGNALDTLEQLGERELLTEATSAASDSDDQFEPTEDGQAHDIAREESLEAGGDHSGHAVDELAAEPVVDSTEGVAQDRAGDGDNAPSDAAIASLLDADSRNHEAARGESITPADSLWRSPDASDN